MNKNDMKKMVIFIILTYSVSWMIWFISGILYREGTFVYDSQWLIAQIGVFVPSITAAVILGANNKEMRNNSYRIIILLILIFAWFFIKTNGSLLIAIFLHTSVNLLSDVGFIYYESSIMIMTLLLIMVAIIVVLQPVMRTEIKIINT